LLVAGGNIIRYGNTGGVVGVPRQVVKTGNEVLGVQCCCRYEELEIGGESRIQLRTADGIARRPALQSW